MKEKFEWVPWVKFKKDADIDICEIKEPPCKHCNFFKPKRIFFNDGTFDGVRICHNDDQSTDFSCFHHKVK